MIFKKIKDPVSFLTHFLGSILSIIGLVILLYQAAKLGKVWQIVSFAIFGASMIFLYTASALYHLFRLNEKGTRIMRKIDHISIFFLIAGSYTPICLIPLRGGWGWSLFGCIWGLAVAGVFFKLFWLKAPRWLSTCVYVIMGWLVIIATWPLVQNLLPAAFALLLAGGIFYSCGATIYGLKKPNPWPGLFGFHEIFHLFVLMGSACHFWLMYKYIMMQN